ncbi:MAG: hypothetical protein NVS2B16_10370 [Chloroflexota bacterium]
MTVDNPSPDLLVVTEDPFNAEKPLSAQSGTITPTSRFYLRNHFSMPDIAADEWRLTIDGDVRSPVHLSYNELLALPHHTLVATLECAGNGLTAFQPACPGAPWKYGAVSTAEWTGVPLRTLLTQAGASDAAQEVVIEGADRGQGAERDATIAIERSLPLDRALHPETLLVDRMNGQTLTREHGFPVRLLVPGWYGMTSVKWVTRVTAGSGPFGDYYQRDRYLLDVTDRSDVVPLGAMSVRSVIADPVGDAVIGRKERVIRGYAWSGDSTVQQVDGSIDGGTSWLPALFTGTRCHTPGAAGNCSGRRTRRAPCPSAVVPATTEPNNQSAPHGTGMDTPTTRSNGCAS